MLEMVFLRGWPEQNGPEPGGGAGRCQRSSLGFARPPIRKIAFSGFISERCRSKGRAGQYNPSVYFARMSERGDGVGDQHISAFDAASYIFQISGEMAKLAGAHRFSKLAAALELSRDLAAETVAMLAVADQAGLRKAAPADET
jgi:hypothetical protein